MGHFKEEGMKNIIKLLVLLGLMVSALFAEENGWFPVQPIAKSSFTAEKEDASIWVLFRKSLDTEQFLVRFPVEPSYTVVDGRFEAKATQGDKEFQLIAFPINTALDPGLQVYQTEGKWVYEQVLFTDHHTYLLRTISNDAEAFSPSYFFASFSSKSLSS
jgi:hypothetical protein